MVTSVLSNLSHSDYLNYQELLNKLSATKKKKGLVWMMSLQSQTTNMELLLT